MMAAACSQTKQMDKEELLSQMSIEDKAHLAIGTGNMINIFSPELVIFGGGVIEAVGDIFLKKILAEVDRYCMPSIRSTVELKNAALGDDSILYGCLALADEYAK